jgi:KUP system potassium uptake protein
LHHQKIECDLSISAAGPSTYPGSLRSGAVIELFRPGALPIDHPELNFHPFYGLVPPGLLYPMVALSTIATVIASQALISGVFSLTQQAIQLGLCPRVHIVHTSADVRGQIFIPGVNFALMLACIGLVLSFKESSGLAGAYGIAVTATMSLTSALYLVATIKVWRWPLWKAMPLVVIFLLFDLAYFGANLLKIFDGGWITIAVAFAIMTTMTTWRKGREELKRKLFANRVGLDVFLSDIERQALSRVRGTAVFMTLSPEGAPPTLLHHVKHNHMLHEHVVLLTLQSAESGRRTRPPRIERLPQGFYRLAAW